MRPLARDNQAPRSAQHGRSFPLEGTTPGGQPRPRPEPRRNSGPQPEHATNVSGRGNLACKRISPGDVEFVGARLKSHLLGRCLRESRIALVRHGSARRRERPRRQCRSKRRLEPRRRARAGSVRARAAHGATLSSRGQRNLPLSMEAKPPEIEQVERDASHDRPTTAPILCKSRLRSDA